MRITITEKCSKEFADAFLQALNSIKYTKLQYDLVDKRTMEDSQSSEATSDASLSIQLQAKPSDKICVAVDVVKRAMTRLDARLHRGYIYKKVPNGKSTNQYTHFCTWFLSCKHYYGRTWLNDCATNFYQRHALVKISHFFDMIYMRFMCELRADKNVSFCR